MKGNFIHFDWLKKLYSVSIEGVSIGYGLPCYIVAEAGVNHNGRLDLALKLIDAAASAGANAVKFQTFRGEQVIIRGQPVFSYQKGRVREVDQVDMLRGLKLKEEWYPELIKHARRKGIIFFSTPHGSFASVDFLESLGAPAFKFGSGELTNLPLLAYAAKFGRPMIISTGMGNLKEVREAVRIVKRVGNNRIIVLQCTTYYPSRPDQANLNAMITMMKEFDVLVGYSSNGLGTQVEVMAATLGACLVEKHLTLDQSMTGPDHKASETPEVFARMVDEIRAVPTILGSGVKDPLPEELEIAELARKSVVTTADIGRGERFTPNNIDVKRPGSGLAPVYYSRILGKRAKHDIVSNKLLEKNDF